MSQPPRPTDPISPLFSEDAEPDGSPPRSPTLTFYGSRQILPLQRVPGTVPPHGDPSPELRPKSQPPPAALRSALGNGVPKPANTQGITTSHSTPRSGGPRPNSATIPAVGARHKTAPRRLVPGSTVPGDAASRAIPVPTSTTTSQSSQVPSAAPNSATIPDKFLITAAWLSGVLVGVIAHSLARGDSWKTGPLREASGPHVIWLRPGASDEAQVAAWLVNSDNSSPRS